MTRWIDESEQEYFKSDADEWEYSAKVQHSWVASKRLGVKSGLSAKLIRNENTTSFADTIYDRSGNRIPVALLGVDPLIQTNASAQKYAAFVEADWLAHPRLNLNFGVRADYYQFLRG